MPKAILNGGPNSIYDDQLPYKYHFTEELRRQITKCKREMVVFYEPEHTGGRKAYTAAAQIVDIEVFDEVRG